jgi:hypothetical protein
MTQDDDDRMGMARPPVFDQVDLFSTVSGDLYLRLIDSANQHVEAWRLPSTQSTRFFEDADAILAGQWHPNDDDGQEPIHLPEWRAWVEDGIVTRICTARVGTFAMCVDRAFVPTLAAPYLFLQKPS